MRTDARDARQVVSQWPQSGGALAPTCRFEGTEEEVKRDPETGIVSLHPLRADSSLARGSDVVLEGGVDLEVCPLTLAPTASTAVAMAIGDALSAVWMERRGISPADLTSR